MSQSSFLNHLSRNIRVGIDDRLTLFLGNELHYSKEVSTKDLINPLDTLEFPIENKFEIGSILDENAPSFEWFLDMKYPPGKQIDSYDMLYMMSLYLWGLHPCRLDRDQMPLIGLSTFLSCTLRLNLHTRFEALGFMLLLSKNTESEECGSAGVSLVSAAIAASIFGELSHGVSSIVSKKVQAEFPESIWISARQSSKDDWRRPSYNELLHNLEKAISGNTGILVASNEIRDCIFLLETSN